MYQHYGSPGDKPIMTMYEGTTSALALRERKEIVLVNQVRRFRFFCPKMLKLP